MGLAVPVVVGDVAMRAAPGRVVVDPPDLVSGVAAAAVVRVAFVRVVVELASLGFAQLAHQSPGLVHAPVEIVSAEVPHSLGVERAGDGPHSERRVLARAIEIP